MAGNWDSTIGTFPFNGGFLPSTFVDSLDILLLSRARFQQSRNLWISSWGIMTVDDVFPNIYSPWKMEALYGKYIDGIFYPHNNKPKLMSMGRWWYPAGANILSTIPLISSFANLSPINGKQMFLGTFLDVRDTTGNGIGDVVSNDAVVFGPAGLQTHLVNHSDMSLDVYNGYVQSGQPALLPANKLPIHNGNYSLEFLKTSPELPVISATPPAEGYDSFDWSSNAVGWSKNGDVLIPLSHEYEDFPLPYFIPSP